MALAVSKPQPSQLNRLFLNAPVVSAHNYTCALTGYRLTTIAAGSIVDAAHIHQFSDSRNNDARNGIALCKNAHWLFDHGLWTLTDEYRVVVADRTVLGVQPRSEGTVGVPRAQDTASERYGDLAESRAPAWHRKHRFKGP